MKVHLELDYYLKGSVIKATVENAVTEVRSHFAIESDENKISMLEVIKLAKQGCFPESLVKNPVPQKSICLLNGDEVSVI